MPAVRRTERECHALVYKAAEESEPEDTRKPSQPTHSIGIMPTSTGAARQLTLNQAAKAAFNKKELSDVTIHIGAKDAARQLPGHSFVLAASSSYFKQALQGKFAESGSKEFVFDEGNPHAYWRVFEYIYTEDYSDAPAKLEAWDNEPDDEELSRDVRVYCLADYFDVPSLKEYALKRFTSKIRELWVSDRFNDCIRNVFDSTTRSGGESLRNAVVEVATDHRTALWAKPAFRDLLREGGDFAEDFVDKMVVNASR